MSRRPALSTPPVRPPPAFVRPALALACAAALVASAGCAMLYPRVQIDDAPPPAPEPAAAPGPASGSLYSGATYRPLFEDHRARLAGDTLVVQIIEKVSATQTSTSTLDKSGSLKGSITALPGIASNSFARAGVGGSSGNTFAGKGSVANSNDFSGTITVVVRAVLPNGHLLIAGEKQIGVNNNIDVLRFSGQVDPRTIMPGNVVQSAQIANVRLEQRGRGAQADAQAIGWLARIFLSVLPI